MDAPDLLALFVRPLEETGLQYMVTGGVASVIYGDPRFTRDVDIVLEMDGGAIPRLVSIFDPDAFYLPPLEALRREVSRTRHGHFNVIHKGTGLRADVYLLDKTEVQQWGFRCRRRLSLGATAISVASPEYVIVQKLLYYRDSGSDRHLRDIAMMLRISGDRIETSEVAQWASRLGLDAQWVAARAFDPT
ncbi:MAG: nucleotidyl transferase AbiEii/AbiGii toxin family protein [Longimicrobiales bacterium]